MKLITYIAVKATGKKLAALTLVAAWLLAGCVQLRAPSEPITINLNVKIEHEIRVKVDKELDDVFAANPDLF
jgi:hypothetical protein